MSLNQYKRDYYINEDGAVIMTSENSVLNSNYIQCIATNKVDGTKHIFACYHLASF